MNEGIHITSLDELERHILGLPRSERAFLADRLLSSLDGEALSDVDATWVAEAERRYQEYENGQRKSIPASQVFAEADQLIK